MRPLGKYGPDCRLTFLSIIPSVHISRWITKLLPWCITADRARVVIFQQFGATQKRRQPQGTESVQGSAVRLRAIRNRHDTIATETDTAERHGYGPKLLGRNPGILRNHHVMIQIG